MKRLIGMALPALALACALPVALASAHGDRHGRSRHEGLRDSKAVAQVEVKGVITAVPSSGSNSFTATTFAVAPRHSRDRRPHGDSGAVHLPAGGAPNTAVTTDAATRVTLDGQASSVGNLAVGDMFVAIYNGTPSEALSAITATPAISVRAWSAPSGDSLYAFVGTVSSTASGSVTVNVTSSFPTGLLSGADTFTVDSQTKVLGNTSLAPGDVVAGGLIGRRGESASTVESSPLQVLVGLPASTSSPSSTATGEQAKRVEHRALELLRREQKKFGRNHDKFGTHRK